MVNQFKGNASVTEENTFFQDGRGGITSLKELRLEHSSRKTKGMHHHDGAEFHGHELPKGWYFSNLGALKPISMEELDKLTTPDAPAAIKGDDIEDLGSIGSDKQLVGAAG